MCKQKFFKFLSMLTISALLFSAAATNNSAFVKATETIAPSVWSREYPYFTDEDPVISDDGMSDIAVFSAQATYPTYAEAYKIMTDLQKTYPEGLRWTNFEPYGSLATDSSKIEGYTFKGGTIKGARLGVGCAAFCFILSDEVFGNVPARVIDAGNFSYDDLHVSDFLRMGGHFVTILKITPSGVIVAEANYNKSVHWGRSISKEDVMSGTSFVVTRYPAGYSEVDEETETASGTENALNWSLSSKGVLTISGKCAIGDYDYQNRPSWEAYKSQIYSVILEDGITSIGDYAFNAMTDMLEVSIPTSVTAIGNSAFRESGLISAILPDSVKTIGNDAFRKCENLASVTIPEGVETVGERAFHSCTELKYVKFPSTLTTLGGGAFTSCNSLNQVIFAPSQASGSLTIGDGAFMQCYYLYFISLPEGLTTLTPNLFSSCQTIYYLYIPSTMTSLAEAGQLSPFNSSSIRTIYFGGTETEWNVLVNKIPAASYSTIQVIKRANVYCEQTDPFVPEPAEDPGDIQFPCSDGHVGERDENGNCIVCGDPMHKHNWSSEWFSNNAYHWHECINDNCDITDNAQKGNYAAHNYGNWSTDLAATAIQSGTRHCDCLTCGYRQTETIPPTETESLTPSTPSMGTESSTPSMPTTVTDSSTPSIPPTVTDSSTPSTPPTVTEDPTSVVTNVPAAPPASSAEPESPKPSVPSAGTENLTSSTLSAETESPAAPMPSLTETPANMSEDSSDAADQSNLDSESVMDSELANSEVSNQKSNNNTLKIIIAVALLICTAGFGIIFYFVNKSSRNNNSN